MKAKISSIRESELHKDSQSHVVSVFFVNPSITANDSAEDAAFFNASIAGGVTEYRMTLDLVRLLGNNDAAKVNNVYDPVKGLAIFKQAFPIGKEMEVELYDVLVSELRPDLQYVIRADNQQPFTTYRRAFKGTREACVEMLRGDLNRSIGRGDFIEPKKEQQPAQPTNPLSNLAGAQVAGEGN